jgi:GrpB-like predicted nucleotidyltransferase (UPF0157 family)
MATVDEFVHLEDPDSRWPQLFTSEQRRLADSLSVSQARIEHIGSTAVPGVIAKPIIDIMMGVDVYPPPPVDIDRVSTLGYECLGEAGVPGRLYLRRRGPRNFNLHWVKMEGPIWQNNIQLREYLAASPDARARYSATKLQAVQNGATQLLAYSAAKAGIVDELLREAALRSNSSLERTRER